MFQTFGYIKFWWNIPACSNVRGRLFAETSESIKDQKEQTLHRDTSQQEVTHIPTVHLRYQPDAHIEVTWKAQRLCFVVQHPVRVEIGGISCV